MAATSAVTSGFPVQHDQQLLPALDSAELMHHMEEDALDPLSHGIFSEINWLEAPMSSALDLSPFSWTLPFSSELADSLLSEVSPTFDPSAHEPNDLTADANTGDHGSDDGDHVTGSVTNLRRGEYYVDGEPARLPRVSRRAHPINKDKSVQTLWSGPFSVHLTDTTMLAHNTDGGAIADANYDTICDRYTHLCRLNGFFEASFTDHEIPPKAILEALIGVFRAKLSPTLPFVHWTSFFDGDRNYILDLAMIAIGAQYVDDPTFGISLHEFTRRCLLFHTESAKISGEYSFCTAAATLLNTIGSAYCGYEPLSLYALRSRNSLIAQLEAVLRQIDKLSTEAQPDAALDQWRSWIQHESNIRLAFSMWLVDTMLIAHLRHRPTLRTDLKALPLPCADRLWQCETLESWHALYKTQVPPSTLEDTLHKLYLSKSFSVKNSEFVRVITIHGLFHRLWDVEYYYSKALSHWEPSSAGYAEHAALPKVSTWLPSVPVFQAWQNSSCDALDILHWQANSTIGQMRGLEHPTVLHLHFARVVLLCPCEEIMTVARHLTSAGADKGKRDDMNRATELVRRWAIYHQYKARLAAIHAGVSLWHIRRHGLDAFYEPSTLGLAILVLWVFSIFADRKKTAMDTSSTLQNATNSLLRSDTMETSEDDQHPSDTNSHSPRETQYILLDRPTDDELVQQFIRDGASMNPFMSGVGEVFAAGAPSRILSRGVELLRQQKHWHISVEWIRLLQQLQSSPPFKSGN